MKCIHAVQLQPICQCNCGVEKVKKLGNTSVNIAGLRHNTLNTLARKLVSKIINLAVHQARMKEPKHSQLDESYQALRFSSQASLARIATLRRGVSVNIAVQTDD